MSTDAGATDGGETWAPNIKATNQPVNFDLGISFNSDIRQPPGVASTNEYTAIAWADPRFADQQTQTQDNVATVAQFDPLPSQDNPVWLILAAVLGGQVLAGLVLHGVQFTRKKRQGRRSRSRPGVRPTRQPGAGAWANNPPPGRRGAGRCDRRPRNGHCRRFARLVRRT